MFFSIVRDRTGKQLVLAELRRPTECLQKLRQAGYEPGAWKFVPEHGAFSDVEDPIALLQLCAYTYAFRYGQATGSLPSDGVEVVFRGPGADQEYAPMILERSSALIQATGDPTSPVCILLVAVGNTAVEHALAGEEVLA